MRVISYTNYKLQVNISFCVLRGFCAKYQSSWLFYNAFFLFYSGWRRCASFCHTLKQLARYYQALYLRRSLIYLEYFRVPHQLFHWELRIVAISAENLKPIKLSYEFVVSMQMHVAIVLCSFFQFTKSEICLGVTLTKGK